MIWAKSGAPQTAMIAATSGWRFALGKWCRPQPAIGAANGGVSLLPRESSAGRRRPRGRREIDGALLPDTLARVFRVRGTGQGRGRNLWLRRCGDAGHIRNGEVAEILDSLVNPA